MITALHESKGLVTVCARLLRCAPTTVENYLARFPACAEARRQEREAMLDVGELALLKAVQAGEGWAVCFLLKTQGKSRGYVERQDVDVRAKVQADVGMTVTHLEAVRAHVQEADVERLTRALLGVDVAGAAGAAGRRRPRDDHTDR